MAFHALKPRDAGAGDGDIAGRLAGRLLPGDDLEEFVHRQAVDLAVAAAGKVIEGKVSGAAAEKMIKDSIAEVKARLN